MYSTKERKYLGVSRNPPTVDLLYFSSHVLTVTYVAEEPPISREYQKLGSFFCDSGKLLKT